MLLIGVLLMEVQSREANAVDINTIQRRKCCWSQFPLGQYLLNMKQGNRGANRADSKTARHLLWSATMVIMRECKHLLSQVSSLCKLTYERHTCVKESLPNRFQWSELLNPWHPHRVHCYSYTCGPVRQAETIIGHPNVVAWTLLVNWRGKQKH